MSSSGNVLEVVDGVDVKLNALDSGGKGEQEFVIKPNGELFNTKLGVFLGVNGAQVKASISSLGANTWEISKYPMLFLCKETRIFL